MVGGGQRAVGSGRLGGSRAAVMPLGTWPTGSCARPLQRAWQQGQQAGHHYLHGAGRGPRRPGDRQGGGPTERGPSASGVPEPLLTELRMSEILGAGVEQTAREQKTDRQMRGWQS